MMRKKLVVSVMFFLCFVVASEGFAFDSTIYNTKRGIRKVLSGGGNLLATSYITNRKTGERVIVPAVTTSIRSSSGAWLSRAPRADGVYEFMVRDQNGNLLSTGNLYRDSMGGLGTFRMAVSNDGKYRYSKFKLSSTAKARLANGENILPQLNSELSKYGYMATLVTRTGRNLRTGESVTYQTVKLIKQQ